MTMNVPEETHREHYIKYIIHDFKYFDSSCICSIFKHHSVGPVITGHLSIVINTFPKYCDPESINWKHNFKILTDFVEYCAWQCTKCGREDTYTLLSLVDQ